MIPFSKPHFTDSDVLAVNVRHMITEDPEARVRDFEAAIAKRMDLVAPQVLVTNSCTAALHLVASYWGHKRVYTPRLTWPSTYAWSAPECRRWVDVDDRGLMLPLQGRLDLDSIILFVDLYGQGVPVHRLQNLPGKFILDAAHNVFAPEHTEILGLPNCLGICYSFYVTKQITTIRGGCALLPRDVDREAIEAMRDSGTIGRRRLAPRGWNYEMPAVFAQLGLNQLARFDTMKAKTQEILGTYRRHLRCDLLGRSGHLAVALFKHQSTRDQVRWNLADEGIQTGWHYPVCNWFDSNKKCKDMDLSRRVLTLPCHQDLTSTDLGRILDLCNDTLETMA